MSDEVSAADGGFTVCILNSRQAEEAAAIEAAAFSVPWTVGELRALGTQPAIRLAGVRNAEGNLLCYAALSCAGGECELLRVATLPEARRRGAARLLLRTLFDRLSASGEADTVYLEVRASGQPAQALYRSLGFREAGIRRHYYRSPAEDAVVMVLRLSPAAPDL